MNELSKTVALCPGHHPGSQGAEWGGISEYQLSSSWIPIIARELRLRGIEVHLIDPEHMRKKVEQVNSLMPDLAVELHFNACGGCGACGCETLYCHGSQDGRRMARAVQARMCLANPPDRGAKEGWSRMDYPGCSDYAGAAGDDEKLDYFLVRTTCPAIIVVPEFIEEQERIKNRCGICCSAIALGILDAIELPGACFGMALDTTCL